MLSALGKRFTWRRDHYSPSYFVNRRNNRQTLVIVLAGYKSYLWPATLRQLEKYAPDDADFCVASAGKRSAALEKMCERNGWSYLSVSRNAPGIALNKAIEFHPSADYIFKLDEDIIVGKDFFSLLRQGYDYAWKDSLLEPGFCAPVLNVNGISYRHFLRELKLEEEYRQEFGQLIARCDGLPVHSQANTAWWLWRNTLPFNEKAARFAQHETRYSLCGTRFSIGAILFRRSFIEQVGGFKSAWSPGVLGVDEDVLCRDCVSQSRPMYIIENVLSGHFSFYYQESLMREKLPELSALDPETFPAEDFALSTQTRSTWMSKLGLGGGA
jgi:hypothetical protein